MSNVDYAWLRMDDPTNLMLINGVLVLDRPLALERLRPVLERRLLPIGRFHQRVVEPPGGGRPHWEVDPAFDLDRHLIPMELPAPGGDAELREVVSGLLAAPLDRSRPLWEFRLIQNYRGGSVLLGRLHHAIGDGVGLMMVLLSLTDVAADAAVDPEALGEPHNPFTQLFAHSEPDLGAVRQAAERIMPEGMRLLLSPAEAFGSRRWATGAASLGALGKLVLRRRDPRTRFKGPLGVAKRADWSEPIPLADVKAVGKALGGTVNDVLLAAVAGGLRRYLLDRGEKPGDLDDLNVRAAMPVNLRPFERMADLGNHFGLVFLSLPLGIADPAERLAELSRRARALLRSAEPVVVYGILKAIGLSPKAIQDLVVRIFATKTTAVMTNVPGPREVLHLAGVPIRDLFFWVPQSGRVGLGISICSYAGQVRLGIGTDARLVPDPEAVVGHFHEELAALQEAARRAQPAAAAPSPLAATG